MSWLWLRMRFVVVGCCGGSKVARFGAVQRVTFEANKLCAYTGRGTQSITGARAVLHHRCT